MKLEDIDQQSQISLGRKIGSDRKLYIKGQNIKWFKIRNRVNNKCIYKVNTCVSK